MLSGNLLKQAQLYYKLAAGKPLILYHGTHLKNLPSILSQGLIPFPKERAWNDDPDASFHRSSRQSIGGTYLTGNLLTAISSGTSHRYKDRPSQAGVIIVEVLPNILISDEDDFANLSNIIEPNRYITEYRAAVVYLGYLINGENDIDFLEMKNHYVNANIKNLIAKTNLHPSLINRLKEVLADGFKYVVARQAAYADDSSWSRAWHDVLRDTSDDKYNELRDKMPPQPSKSIVEKEYTNFMDILTKAIKIRHIKSPKDEYMFVSRTLHPIDYTGNSKIVAVLEIDRKLGDGTKAIKTLYPNSWQDVPKEAREDFEAQWKSKIGSLDDIKFI